MLFYYMTNLHLYLDM